MMVSTPSSFGPGSISS